MENQLGHHCHDRGARVDLKPQSVYRGEIKINEEDLHNEFDKNCKK